MIWATAEEEIREDKAIASARSSQHDNFGCLNLRNKVFICKTIADNGARILSHWHRFCIFLQKQLVPQLQDISGQCELLLSTDESFSKCGDNFLYLSNLIHPMDISQNQHQYSNSQRNDTGRGQLLTPFQRKLLQKSLQEDLHESYHQRIQIMLLADEGKSQTEICQTLGCCPATARHWMHIARSGMAHQWQDCSIGRPKKVNEQYLERLQEIIAQSPREHGYAFRRWTVNWLKKHLAKEFGIEVSDGHFKRLLKQMGLSTRPKPVEVKSASDRQKEGQSILIYDLKSPNDSESNSFWLFNSANLK